MSSARYGNTARERTQLFSTVRPFSPATGAPQNPDIDLANPFAGASASGSAPQFTETMYDQLESQHDEQFSVLSSKISMLKDITTKIGAEVQEGTGMLSKLEDGFDTARVRVRNTMTRMVHTAKQSGVGWRAWLILFGMIIFCFWVIRFI